jgi:hypothetical protein
MSARIKASVSYANGIAAEGVKISIFDRDVPGKLDDDLTLTPGISDRQGFFSLEYDPDRYQDGSQVTVTVPRNPPFDWTLENRIRIDPDRNDSYQPYLRFSYQINGKEITHTADLKSRFRTYTLPDELPTRFTPSQHGWNFPNAFSGFFLPFALPMIPGLTNPGSVYGLCGGMTAGALDMFLTNHQIPDVSKVPENGSPIQRFLFKRQLDSMGTLGETILRFSDWMGLPDDTPHGTQKLTLDEFEKKIRPRLNKFTPTPIGMLYVKWKDSHEVWLNHQVLAVRYERDSPSRLRIYIYDPNFPNRDDISIDAEKVDVGGDYGLRLVQRIGATETKKLYGIMVVPYNQVTPPQEI